MRFNASLVLGELGEKAAESVSSLIKCLEDNDWSICREATRSLGKIGASAVDAIPRLAELLPMMKRR